MPVSHNLPYLMGIVIVVFVVLGVIALTREMTVEGFELKALGLSMKTRKLTTRTRRKG